MTASGARLGAWKSSALCTPHLPLRGVRAVQAGQRHGLTAKQARSPWTASKHQRRAPPLQAAEPAEPEPEPSSPLFTAQFSEALKGALDRQGSEAMMSGSKPAEEEDSISAQEEVLYAAMADSRRTQIGLERQAELIQQSIVREKRQFERLHFCLKKARSDAAYMKAMDD